MTDLPIVPVRNLIGHSAATLFEMLDGELIVEFDDKQVKTHATAVVISRFAWAFFEEYPKTPILSTHLIDAVLKNGEYGHGDFIKLMQNIFFDVYDAYLAVYVGVDPAKYDMKSGDLPPINAVKGNHDILRNRLCEIVYEVSNESYNFLQKHLAPWRGSLDILDFLKIRFAPDIAKQIDALPSTQSGMEAADNLVLSAIKDDPRFRYNQLAQAVRTGISRTGQAVQCLGFRGYLTDVSSVIFREPIHSGYITGIRSGYDSLIETRSGAKSLYSAEGPLQRAEYFSRRQQFVCMNVKNLHFGDCGSTEYVLWRVRDKHISEETGRDRTSDLKSIAGKYYLDETTNKMRMILETDTHLVGKVLKIRSTIAGCKHPDPYGVCMTCFGGLGLSFPADTNLGHGSCVSMTAIIGQLILSTKHFDGSSVVDPVVIGPEEAKYLTVKSEAGIYYLSEKIKKADRIWLRVMAADAPGLTDIHMVDNVRVLNLTRTSEFENVALEIVTGKEVTRTSLVVKAKKRKASMSVELLEYIRENGEELRDEKNHKCYWFDLTRWPRHLPLFVLPMAHFNMSDHQSEIAMMLERTKEGLESHNRNVTPQDMLLKFHDLVSERMTVNLSVLEIVLYSSLVADAEAMNFNLPKVGDKFDTSALKQLMTGRAVAPVMAYERQRDFLLDPATYLHNNRPKHPFDVFLFPEEFNSRPDLNYLP